MNLVENLESRPAPRRQGAASAFTLVELLIVIGIIAILAGLLLPALAQARREARRVQSLSNVRQINLGVLLYANDHADRMPVAAPHELGGRRGLVPEQDPWLPARMGGVVSPMGIAKFVGVEFTLEEFADQPLPLGASLATSHHRQPAKKVVLGSIPIHRTMSGVVAISPRAQWYRPDPERLWANAAFLDGHVAFVNVFAYDARYGGVMTLPSKANPYY